MVQVCLRVLPWPTGPRLIRVGNPGRNSPVLVTCNYHFTVWRVLQALRGQNAYLLVAPAAAVERRHVTRDGLSCGTEKR